MFSILPVSQNLRPDLEQKINGKTKPPGSLGRLEEIAVHIGMIQGTLTPALRDPHIVVFAGDHGVAVEGISAFPQDVTWQMVLNFLEGGSAISVFARENNLELTVVDAGVNHTFAPHPKLVDAKIGRGTQNFLYMPAMSNEECAQAMARSASIVREKNDKGCNVIGFGEMGIGNTSSAALLLSILGDIPLERSVGRGTGLDDAGLARKIDVLSESLSLHRASLSSPTAILATFGGFEIAMLTGALLAAAERKMVIIIDGFIVTAALLVAAAINPAVLDYCIASHRSNEQAHGIMLEKLNLRPLLDLDLRLGEGTGAALAYPLINASVAFLNDMASFESASVSTKSN